MKLLILIFCTLACLLQTVPAIPRGEVVTATLISAEDGLLPGTKATLGLQLEIADHWHTYWRNPGDSGFPPSLAWDLPAGFQAGALAYPAPTRFTTAGSAGFGYEHEVIHVFELSIPPGAEPGSRVILKAKARWLACDPLQCFPGEASLEISLPVKATPKEISATSHAPKMHAAAPPKRMPGKVLTITEAGESLSFEIPAVLSGDGLDVFCEAPSLIDYSAPAEVTNEAGKTVIVLPKHQDFSEIPAEVGLVLVPENGEAMSIGTAIPVVEKEVVIKEPAAAPAPEKEGNSQLTRMEDQREAIQTMHSWGVAGDGPERGFLAILVLALLGGAVLNLMPCVFPVLGVKIMGFVQQAGEDRKTIRQHGLVFGAGVLVSLWTLAAVILAIRLGGSQVGWGFQLQNPIFVLVMIVVIFTFGLNLAGLFEFGTSLIGAGQGLQHKHGYAGSFFSGVLAVAIATPCTGPFMGAALTYALTAPISASLLVFTALGVGLALPYVLLSFFPALIENLPRPGPWMETFKQFMAFPMLATAVWLLGVLARSLGSEGSSGSFMGSSCWLSGFGFTGALTSLHVPEKPVSSPASSRFFLSEASF